MRIAFVTAYPPSPLRVRAYSFVRELAHHHTVTVVTLCHSDQDVDAAYALRRCLREHPCRWPMGAQRHSGVN